MPFISVKMEPNMVMEWIKIIENHFECEGISKAQKVKVYESQIREVALP